MLESGEVFPFGNLSGTREELNILRFKNVCTPNVYYHWFVPRFFAFLANEEWLLSVGTLPLPPCDVSEERGGGLYWGTSHAAVSL